MRPDRGTYQGYNEKLLGIGYELRPLGKQTVTGSTL